MITTKIKKRKLTAAEEKNIRKKIQSTASALNKILENPKINKEQRMLSVKCTNASKTLLHTLED